MPRRLREVVYLHLLINKNYPSNLQFPVKTYFKHYLLPGEPSAGSDCSSAAPLSRMLIAFVLMQTRVELVPCSSYRPHALH